MACDCSSRRPFSPDATEEAPSTSSTSLRIDDFDLPKHVKYFRKHARMLPEQYKSMDTNRLTLLYFSISGLELLGKLEEEVDCKAAIEYIYSYQSSLPGHGGFYGYPKVAFESEDLDRCNNQPHIANTYVALVLLIILGDDLARINRPAVAESLRKWQLPDGSFCCVHGLSSLDSESDMRFVYCAASICFILDLWQAVDVEAMLRFILSAQSYDGAFGMGPLTESHGGCTYCALASLSMMGRLPEALGLPGVGGGSSEQLLGWCVRRQLGGLQGRVEKDVDSCYSFWVGGSLQILGAGSWLDGPACVQFLKRCENSSYGGFQKFPEVPHPDILHSYFSVCGLALCGLLPPLNATLGMSERAFQKAAVLGGFRMAPGGRPWSITPSTA
ncbi:unnamed protein product [Polarella glacialis]|uniref:Prenyltransferase alpha-alpha toroid domain-containing protein n=1 Tax=Polarella glacialis TaxID=89957 RepID=A0A813J3N3_POLGL|nr:unnamed protein product [Polarella glacialis]